MRGAVCDTAHKPLIGMSRSGLSGAFIIMLLPSIMKILDQNQGQLKAVEQTKVKAPAPGSEKSAGLQQIELEIAAAAELVKPAEVSQPNTATQSTGPFLEELLRAITKFEKSDQSRVVDVFE